MTDNGLSGEIIGAAIEVHRALGPGLLESIYEQALVMELVDRGLTVSEQVEAQVAYKGKPLSGLLRLDILVNDLIVVEIKAVERILSVHEAQLLSYLRLSNKKLGLLINFNVSVLTKAVRRIVNQF